MKSPAHLILAVVLTLLAAVAAQAHTNPPPPPMPAKQPWKSGATTVTVDHGTFRVKGFGPMANYGPGDGYSEWYLAEWYDVLPWFSDMIIEEGVTHIGDFLFERSCNLQSVVIPASVASIGENAFKECYRLTSIKIAEDNTRYRSVDGVVFNKDKTALVLYPNGKQGSYTIPNGVTTIGKDAFFNAGNLESVTIPNSVTTIEEHAFGGCRGKMSITIPNSVTAIGKYAFAAYKMGYFIIGGPSSAIETDHENRFVCCHPDETMSITISNSVTAIEDYTFAGACLESIIIPNSVTAIGEGAFRDCGRLSSVTIPKNVKSIGKDAFKFCEGLTSLTIKEGVTTIGDYAFAGCKSLKHVIIPNSVVSMGDYAFAGCDSLSLTRLTIEKGVKPLKFYEMSAAKIVSLIILTTLALFAAVFVIIKKLKKPSALKKIALFVLRAVLVIAPIAWIYARTDAGSIVATLATASVPAIIGVTVLLIVSMALQGVKWWVLIRRFVPDLGVGRAVSVHFESNFYSILLPSALAQDVVKSVMLSKNHDPAAVWASSWLGRLIGFLALLSYSLIGLAILGDAALPHGFRASLFVTAGVIALLCVLSFSKRFTRPLGIFAERIAGGKALASVKKLRDGIYAFRHERATLSQTFLISASIQLLLIFNASLLIYAVSGKFFFLECLAFVPLVEIMAISLPLTPGGLGIREALMALLFTRLGFSEGQTASYVTISLALSMTKLAGGIPVIWKSFKPSAKTPPQT